MFDKRWMKSRPRQIVIAVLCWTILGCLFALPDLSAGAGWRHALLTSLSVWWCWGLISPLIIWVDRLIPVSTKQLSLRVLVHLVPSLLLTSVYAYLLASVRATFGIVGWEGLSSASFLLNAFKGMFLWNWLNYWLILGAWQAYQYYDHYIDSQLRLERLERNFSEARLNALRMQLNPHFLFNALNTISSQLEREPKLARRMIEHLGDLLRLSLESKDRQEVPLSEEMAFLQHYLEIQKIRFGDHLRIETQIAADVRFASVPFLCVQPLVENAIQHGISKRASGGTVIVSAVRVDNRLDLRVLDDGVGLPNGWTLENSSGVGLSVTRERVAGLYPPGETDFALHRRAVGGTEVKISLPLKWAGKDNDGTARA